MADTAGRPAASASATRPLSQRETETRDISSKPVDLVAARRMYAKTANLIMLWKHIYARWTPEERQAFHYPHCKMGEIQRFLEGAPDTWKAVEYNSLAVSDTHLHAQLESKTARFGEVALFITRTSELPRATRMWADLESIECRVFDEDMSAQLAAIENSRLSAEDVKNALFSSRLLRDLPTTTEGWLDITREADLEILAIRRQLNRSHCEIERLNNTISKMPNADAEGAAERKKAADENRHLQTRLRIALKEIEGIKDAALRMPTKDKEAAGERKNATDEGSTLSDLRNAKADNTTALGWFDDLNDAMSVTEIKEKLLETEKDWELKYTSMLEEVNLYNDLYRNQINSLEKSRAEARQWEHGHDLQVQEAKRWQTKYEAEAEKASNYQAEAGKAFKYQTVQHLAEGQVKRLEAALKVATGDLNRSNAQLEEYRAKDEAARAGSSSSQRPETNPAPRSEPNLAKAWTRPRPPQINAYQRPTNPPGARQGRSAGGHPGTSAGGRHHPNNIPGTTQQAGAPSSSYWSPAQGPQARTPPFSE
ncbi:uncharacterized protein CcaverHIS019_0507220 [Cutaneotrichosporon cavernicola]|uniref:Uncharacterized protein n=1 Tax=Cutaneotrichosporon cavernicola TaxID=279322 RepID=A0AA48L6W2_9TREE|nr:uncharacterized protein CcaverHIS019_0507220 [Cutaneotrichosporon cavernicola]BEI93094.1 hypothetical protein CcaverHIS019_0507220 [Cutaneotrichosporon cavernicola]